MDEAAATPMGPETLAFIDSCRRAVLATTAPDGRVRLVPICFAVAEASTAHVVYTPLDEKPKRAHDVRALARVRDILARPAVAILFDRWSEDWSELAWVRVDGEASLLEPDSSAATEHDAAVRLLRARYPQYQGQALDRLPLIRVKVRGHQRWHAAAATRPGRFAAIRPAPAPATTVEPSVER